MAKKSTKQRRFFVDGKEPVQIQAGVVALVFGAVLLCLLAAKMYAGY